jgi:CRP-like cAMP-binding protein
MDLHDIAFLLSKSPFLSNLTLEALQLLAFSGDQLRFARGETIFEAGHKSEGGHLVLEGRVDLFLPRKFSAPVQTIGVGGLIGEVALITPTDRPVWAVAASECKTLKITRGAVWRVLHEFPEGAEALRQTLVRRVRSLLDELSSAQSAKGRLPI